MKACVSCKFYRKPSFFSIRGPLCANEKCNEASWEFSDPVTGETRKYEARAKSCSSARLNPCGNQGQYWEPAT